MSVKAVYYMKHFCILRCLLRKICRTSPAQDQNIDPILPLLYPADAAYSGRIRENLHILRISSGKYSLKLHIRILADGAFHTPPQITIA